MGGSCDKYYYSDDVFPSGWLEVESFFGDEGSRALPSAITIESQSSEDDLQFLDVPLFYSFL